MNKKSKSIILILSTFLLLLSCEMQEKKSKYSPRLKSISIESEATQKKPFIDSMSNPVMMKSVDIGRMFNAYYKTSQTTKMVELLDAKTKQKFTFPELEVLLKKLDYGFDIKLSGMKEEAEFKILNYTCLIQQTKIIKQLKVKIENDTARICPKNLSKGLIFQ